jgi:tape measure domain-containing protein
MAQDALIRIRAKVSGQSEVKNLERQFKQTERQTNSLKQSFAGLRNALAGVGVAFAAFRGLRFAVIKTAELETQTRSLQVLTGSLESAKGIISELQQFAAVTPFTSSELIETSKRLKAFGVDTENLVDTVKRLGDVSGATGADLSGIATAFGQIQAKGRLQGEELLQLQERGVALAEVLKEEYNLTGEEFSKALQKGQISAEAVNYALVKLTETGGKYADGAISQSDTLAGKFSTLQDNIQRIARAIGQLLAPALKRALDFLNGLISRLSDLQFGLANVQVLLARTAIGTGLEAQGLDNLQTAVDSINLGLIENEAQAKNAEAAINGISNALKLVTSDPQAVERQYPAISSLIEQLDFLRNTLKAVRQEGFAAPTGGGGLTLPKLTAGTADKEGKGPRQKSVEDFIKGALDPAVKAEQAFAKQAIEIARGNELLQARLAGTEQEETTLQSINRIIESAGIKDAERVQDARRTLQVLFDQKTALEGQIDAQEELTEKQEAAAAKMDQLYKSIGSSISSGIVDTLTAAVDKTKSLRDVAAATLKDISQIILKFAVNQFLAGSFPKIFGSAYGNVFERNNIVPFARGGVVNQPTVFPMANGMGLMGEAGPEAVMPLRRGRDGRLGVESSGGGIGNIVVNVDASGTQAQGDTAESRQLGEAIGSAVRQEILKQKRPGGLLA